MIRSKPVVPATKVWRISQSAPMGAWVSMDAPIAGKPRKELPEVSGGTWVMWSFDLLDGTEVTEGALPGGLFDELFGPRQVEPKTTRK